GSPCEPRAPAPALAVRASSSGRAEAGLRRVARPAAPPREDRKRGTVRLPREPVRAPGSGRQPETRRRAAASKLLRAAHGEHAPPPPRARRPCHSALPPLAPACHAPPPDRAVRSAFPPRTARWRSRGL